MLSTIRTVRSLVIATACFACSLGTPARAGAGPDTLVVKAKDGTFAPGVATSWRMDKDIVVFTLAKDAKADDVAQTLRQRLANAEVGIVNGELRIHGIARDVLLSQLANLSLSATADPLDGLAGLSGTVVAMNAPEAGGSIRACRPTELPAAAMTPAEPGIDERFDGEILEVSRGAFPTCSVKLKVLKPGSSGPLAKKFHRGDKVDATVMFAQQAGHVDFADAITQRNLAAFYATAGDRFSVHMLIEDGKIVLDWVERATKK